MKQHGKQKTSVVRDTLLLKPISSELRARVVETLVEAFGDKV
jgi:hypothetical protein